MRFVSSTQQKSNTDWPRTVVGIAVATAGGALCASLHTPLPWMIGPLLALAVCNFSGARLPAVPLGREFGQFFIAVTLGLYFTPQVADEVLRHGFVLLTAAISAIGIGWLSGRLLCRFGKVDRVTAFFACIPGGATEMATLGDRFGAATDKVAVAHSLRILLVVCTIPVALTLLGVQGTDTWTPTANTYSARPLVLVIAASLLGGALVAALRYPNPWMIGPLIATIALTASETTTAVMPRELSNVGQVLIGGALGARFSRAFLREAPRFLTALLLTIYGMMILSSIAGVALAQLTGLLPSSMILATAPGGIAEMAITASALHLGVALVTAAHVTRMFVLVSLTLPLWQLLNRRPSHR